MSIKRWILFAAAAGFLCYNVATEGLNWGNGLVSVFFIFCVCFSVIYREKMKRKAAETEEQSGGRTPLEGGSSKGNRRRKRKSAAR